MEPMGRDWGLGVWGFRDLIWTSGSEALDGLERLLCRVYKVLVQGFCMVMSVVSGCLEGLMHFMSRNFGFIAVTKILQGVLQQKSKPPLWCLQ